MNLTRTKPLQAQKIYLARIESRSTRDFNEGLGRSLRVRGHTKAYKIEAVTAQHELEKNEY